MPTCESMWERLLYSRVECRPNASKCFFFAAKDAKDAKGR